MRIGQPLPVTECVRLVTLPRWCKKINFTDTCWLWTAAADKYGYGRVSLCGASVLAHRVAWVGSNNQDIRPGLDINHLCRITACVRPDHLQEASARENLLYGDTIPSQRRARETCPRGHLLADGNLVRRSRGDRECWTCAKASNIARNEIVQAARAITGLSVTDYHRQYGFGPVMARQIVEEAGRPNELRLCGVGTSGSS
jgi:hypothetical protein